VDFGLYIYIFVNARGATPELLRGVSQTPHPTACPQAGIRPHRHRDQHIIYSTYIALRIII